MTTGKYVAFRRRREGKTDYKKRRLLLSSRENIRLVIRTSLKHTLCQLITYEPQGDKVLITIDSKALIKLGWPYHTGSVPAAYLTGILLGKKAKEKKITQAILDIGLHPSIKGNRVYAAAKGAQDAGLQLSLEEEMVGDKARLQGTHIAAYAKQLKKENKFAQVFKGKQDPEQIPGMVATLKQKIMG